MPLINDLLNKIGIGLFPINSNNQSQFQQFWVVLDDHYFILEGHNGSMVAYNHPPLFVASSYSSNLKKSQNNKNGRDSVEF